ncbi:hypothetical protein BASA81_012814 [Batrachochytrium salamandrivorans]|nr:hypothetical protein BASA81_012814 [Batrachochytrium salamandrivorans]
MMWWLVVVTAMVALGSPTGHRVVTTLDDFENYVLHEHLPTILLVHSSLAEDCKYGYDCAKLYESFKRAAMETKGYVRFASIDFGEAEGKALVKHRLEITEEPPIMMAFGELSDPKVGRPAQMVHHLDKMTHSQLKSLASNLLPKHVHQSTTLEDFTKVELEAYNRHKKPLMVVLAPKISRSSATVRSIYALVQTVANLTVVETSTEPGRAILRRLNLVELNSTQVVGLDKLLGQINGNLTLITPDTVLEFATRLDAQRKEHSAKKQPRALPRGVFANLPEAELLAMTQHSLPTITWFVSQTTDAVKASEALHALPQVDELLHQFGISTFVYLNGEGEDRFQVHSLWMDAPKTFASHADAAAFAQSHLLSQRLDHLDEVDGNSIGDYFVQSASLWKDSNKWNEEKMTFVYISGEENSNQVPQYLQAAAFATKKFAKFVHLTWPYSDEDLRSIHLQPSKVITPYLVAYVPNLTKEREAIAEEEQELADLAKEAAKDRRKKKSQPVHQSKNRGVNFHIIPFETNPNQPRGMNFDFVTEYAIAMLQSLDKSRWESTVLYELPKSGTPHNIYLTLVKQVQDRKRKDGTMMPDIEVVASQDEFDSVCDGAQVCAMAFASNVTQLLPILLEAKRELEKSSTLAVGVRMVVVDGSCHYRVVDQFGGDASMLPSFALWNRKSNSIAWLRGTLGTGSVLELVKQFKRNQLGMQKLTPQTSLLFEKECVDINSGGEEEEEDELIKEMRLEAQREEEEKERRKLEAIQEAKRLKAQQEAEKKATKERMNQKANEERNKNKKQEL